MSQVYSIPREEGDHQAGRRVHHHGLPTLALVDDTSLSYSFFMNTSQDHVANNGARHYSQQVHQKEPNEQFLFIRSTDHPVSYPANKDQVQSRDRYVADDKDDPNGATEWMPSKMRFIRKMMNSDHMVANKPRGISRGVVQDQTEINQELGATSNHTHNSPNGIIRVCSDCNTTKTPLWRSGPRGPKSLCNACGIRQRKARRAAMAAAAAAANGGLIPSDAHMTKVRKEKRPNDDRTVPFKKRCKFTAGSAQKNVRFDDFTISLSKSSAFQYQVFPQDERDAAILLMALSCGLIRSG